MTRRLVVLVVSLILAGALSSAHAQVRVAPPEVFVIEGRVVWMSAQQMVVAPANDFPINVNLARISQADLRKISQNDYVIVTGQLFRPTRTVLALSIEVISPWYPVAPQAP